jgi:hypothetical protein
LGGGLIGGPHQATAAAGQLPTRALHSGRGESVEGRGERLGRAELGRAPAGWPKVGWAARGGGLARPLGDRLGRGGKEKGEKGRGRLGRAPGGFSFFLFLILTLASY